MSRTWIVVFAITLAVSGFAAAQAPVEPESVRIEAGPAPAEPSKLVKPQLSPMHQEIAALQERLTQEVAELGQRFTAAADAQARLQIQLRIDKAKRDMQLGSLEIQLRYAQAEGREEVAAKLEQAIETFKNPVAIPAKPVDRPIPSTSTQH